MSHDTSRPGPLSRALAGLEEDAEREGLEVAVAADDAGPGIGSFAFGSPGIGQFAWTFDRGPWTFGNVRARADDADDEAIAFGLFLDELDGGDGRDVVSGAGNVAGTTQAEVRGVSIGKDIAGDPDFIESDAGESDDSDADDEGDSFGPGVEDVIPAVAARADLGTGKDRVIGTTRLDVDAGDATPIFYANTAVIIDEDSVLRLGDGDDVVRGVSRTTVRAPAVDGGDDRDGNSQPDPDTEAIVDGIENVGLLDAGDGDDRFVARVDAESESGTALVGSGIDNGSFGNLNQVAFDDPGAGGARFLAGDGDDVVDIRASLSNVGEGSILDGWSNLSVVDLGDGDDRVTIRSRNEFIDTDGVVGEQEEVITDGLDNRATFLMGDGDDTLRASARSEGNGVLVNAGAIDSRGDPSVNRTDENAVRGLAIDAGAGDDTMIGDAVGVVTAPVNAELAAEAPRKTLINGWLLESNAVSENRFGAGDDTIEVSARAFGRDTDTAAIGMNAVSINIPNPRLQPLTRLDEGDDTVEARGVGEGSGKVAAYGLNGGELQAGDGADRIEGVGHAVAGADVEAVGIRLDDDFDLFGGTDDAESAILSSEGAGLDTGAGDDEVEGVARLGDGVEGGEAAGIFLGEDGVLATGDGDDRVIGRVRGDVNDGTANAIGGEATGVLDTGAGDDVVDARAGGFGGGFALGLGAGDDVVRGFGDVVIDGGDGRDSLELDVALQDFVEAGGGFEQSDDTFALSADDGAVTLVATGIETVAFADDRFSAAELGDAFTDVMIA